MDKNIEKHEKNMKKLKILKKKYFFFVSTSMISFERTTRLSEKQE